MWAAVELASDHSGWNKLGSANDLETLKSMEFAESAGSEVYYFWDAKFPVEPDAMQKLYDEMVAANGGIEMRVMAGALLSRLEDQASEALCSGQCFCVQQGSSRRCEVCYQGGGGPVCVPCGSGC